jgi:septal ring factor EnvC (AmiA/AmiB activator)
VLGRGLWTLALAALLVGSASWAATGQDNAAKLAELRRRIETLQAELDQARGQRDSLRTELGDIERRVGALTQRLREIDAELDRNATQLAELEVKHSRLGAELAIQQNALGRQLRAAYAMGQQQYVKMLLSQEEPARLGRVLTYYRYLNQARSERINTTRSLLERLKGLEDEIEQHTRELESLRTGQLDSKAELDAARAQRTEVVAALNRQVRSQSQEIARLRVDEERLKRLIEGLSLYMEELKVAVPGDERFDRFRGRLRLPVRGKVAARFGEPKQGGPIKWDGVLLKAPEGREVHAVYRGRVAFADWFGSLGLLVILDHGDGYMSLYGHNQSLYAQVGDWVDTGQVIAGVGNSGGLADPGLYFEIRHNGTPRNPLRWCRAA